ncbi:energy transducer TonB, partial [Pseudomonas aeruginosa]|nr:energy transducer TonB [Pseudomonas aeruginosa]
MTRPDSDAAPYDPVLEQTAQAWPVRPAGTPRGAPPPFYPPPPPPPPPP